jgi:hypothetical protein
MPAPVIDVMRWQSVGNALVRKCAAAVDGREPQLETLQRVGEAHLERSICSVAVDREVVEGVCRQEDDLDRSFYRP